MPDGIEDDDLAQLLLQYIKDQINQPDSCTMDESAVLALTGSFMDVCYNQKISGDVA